MATTTVERRPTILTFAPMATRGREAALVVHPKPVDLPATAALVVDAPSSRVGDLAPVIAAARRRRILRGVLIRQDSSFEHTRQVLSELGLSRAPRLLVARSDEVRRRVLQALAWGAQDQLIADAEVSGEVLQVRSCGFERLTVPLSALPGLRGLGAEELRQFELDADGSYLYWPAADAHLDLAALRQAVQPEQAARARAERLRHDARLGQAIATVRARHGLTQARIEGLSERQVRRLEQGSRPRLETLRRLAAAHGQTVDDYLRELAEAMPPD